MQSWRETVPLTRPLRDARLAAAPFRADQERRVRARERAGFERGRIEGERALAGQLLQQRSEVLQLQNGVLQTLRQTVPQTILECEGMLVELAVEVARKLVAGLPISVEMVEAAVREALSQVEEKAGFTLLLHPEDLELLQQVNSPVLLADAGGARMNFIASAEVARGGCMVQTRFGVVDARRETKLDLLKMSLNIGCN